MALKLFLTIPDDVGFSTAVAIAEKHNATLIPLKLSGSPVPSTTGPFVVDNLSMQSLDIQRWVLANLSHYDFYLVARCGETLEFLYPPLARYLQHLHPEAFI